MDKFIDRNKGEAHFDGEDFINTLKFAKNFPVENDQYRFEKTNFGDPRENFVNGKQLLYNTYIMSNISELRALYKLTDGNIVFTGFPGIGRNIVRPMEGVGISAGSKHPELCWEYIKQRVLDDGFGAIGEDKAMDYRGRWTLPLNKAELERFFETQMTVFKDENGEEMPHETVSIGYNTPPTEVELFAMSEAEREFVMSVFDNCILQSVYDDGLMSIINEEVEPYLKENKSLEQTVSIIQNRASVYVSERS